MNFIKLLGEVTNAVLHAGRLLSTKERATNDFGLVAGEIEVGIEIELVLLRHLLALLDCDFWGKETGYRLTGHRFCWVVDPNDNGRKLSSGPQESAISVGLLRNAVPILGAVFAPMTDRGPDCISWTEGLDGVMRNGRPVDSCNHEMRITAGCKVMVDGSCEGMPYHNTDSIRHAEKISVPSVAYRLARVAAGDAIVGISLVPVAAHVITGAHALLIGSKGVLIDQQGNSITYATEARLSVSSVRCFGGAPRACIELSRRRWDRPVVR